MTQPTAESEAPPESSDGLDFERATFAEGNDAQRMCSVCSQPVKDAYYVRASMTVCDSCQPQVAATLAQSSFWTALGYGSLAAVVGALVWYGIRALTGYELGLIAIVVGVAVGIGVRKGARGSRSVGYRVLAVMLTYFSIVSTYVPELAESFIQGLQEGEDENEATPPPVVTGGGEADDSVVPPPSFEDSGAPPVDAPRPALLVLFGYLFGAVMALIMPFLMLMDGQIMGVVILGIGIWEAWRRSGPSPEDELAGPYRLADAVETSPAREAHADVS